MTLTLTLALALALTLTLALTLALNPTPYWRLNPVLHAPFPSQYMEIKNKKTVPFILQERYIGFK